MRSLMKTAAKMAATFGLLTSCVDNLDVKPESHMIVKDTLEMRVGGVHVFDNLMSHQAVKSVVFHADGSNGTATIMSPDNATIIEDSAVTHLTAVTRIPVPDKIPENAPPERHIEGDIVTIIYNDNPNIPAFFGKAVDQNGVEKPMRANVVKIVSNGALIGTRDSYTNPEQVTKGNAKSNTAVMVDFLENGKKMNAVLRFVNTGTQLQTLTQK